MKKSLRLILLSVVALALLGFVSYKIISTDRGADTRRQGAVLVKIQKPIIQTVLDKLEFNGDLMPIHQATIYAKVGGSLESVRVEMGMFVRQNQLLATIDSIELEDQVIQSVATYTNARLNYERGKKLFEQNLEAKQDLDNLDASLKVAKSTYELAVTRLGYARIVAPFSGFVTKRYLDPGALVNANSSTLFMLMNLDSIKIIVNVPEKNVPAIYGVKEATVTLDALPGKKFSGILSRFSESIDLSTRTMAIEVDVPNRDRVLKPGMFATIEFITSQHPNAITIPTVALLRDDAGYFVYGVDNKIAKRLRVQLGLEQASKTEITSWLKGDEDIIVAGGQFVKEGSPVNIQQ
jgi:membrane fusion protein (multidrug efflux system)